MLTRSTSAAAVAAFVLTAGILVPVQLLVDPPMLLAERFVTGLGWGEIGLLGLWAAWLTTRILNDARSALWRQRLWRLFSIVFFLQLILGLAGVEECLMTGRLHVPVPALIVGGPIFRCGDFFMPILLAATLVLVGPAWCSHLCYIGAWDDVAAKALVRPRPLSPRRNMVRVAVLAGVITAALALRELGAPTALAAVLALLFGVAGIGVMVLVSRRTGVMAHCAAFCPIGWITTTLGRLNPFRIKVGRGCAVCGLCTPSCRFDALDTDVLAQGRVGANCTLCGDCVAACHMRELDYAFPGLSAPGAKILFRVLAVSLHAAFLGLARL